MDPLLQDHYRDPLVAVHEVYPECAAARRPPVHPPTGQVMSRASRGKDTRKVLESSGGLWSGGEALQLSSGHPVMGLYVGHQGPSCQVCITIGAEESLAEPVPVGFPLPRHLESVGLFKVTPKRAACLASHAHCIGNICAE